MRNPFEAPSASLELGAEAPSSEALAIRQAHLAHEERVLRSGSWLVFIGTLLGLFSAVYLAVSVQQSLHTPRPSLGPILELSIALALGGGYVALGVELLKLRGGKRILTATACVPLLVALPPIGTWLALRMMHALLSKKGETVLSLRYHQIRAATPELKPPRLTWVVPFVGAFVVVGALSLVALAMFS